MRQLAAGVATLLVAHVFLCSSLLTAAQEAGADAGASAPPVVWILGVGDPATAGLAQLLDQHEELDVRLSGTDDCRAIGDGQLLSGLSGGAQGKLLVAACAQLWVMGAARAVQLLDEALQVHGVGRPASKALLILRDEPEYVYDAWHTWCWPELDEGCDPKSPLRRPEHARTPDAFHALASDATLAAKFPPLAASTKAQFNLYRGALGDRLLALSAHQLWDRPWETMYRIESFLGINHMLYPPDMLKRVVASANDSAVAASALEFVMQRPGEPAPALQAAAAGRPPMQVATHTALQQPWVEDCRHLTEKAHVWFPSCPVIAADGPGGTTRGARPVLQRRTKAVTSAKLIGLLRSKKRELLRGANLHLQQLGVRNVKLGLFGLSDGGAASASQADQQQLLLEEQQQEQAEERQEQQQAKEQQPQPAKAEEQPQPQQQGQPQQPPQEVQQ